jgi:hypothetical protein
MVQSIACGDGDVRDWRVRIRIENGRWNAESRSAWIVGDSYDGPLPNVTLAPCLATDNGVLHVVRQGGAWPRHTVVSGNPHLVHLAGFLRERMALQS